MLWNCSIGQLWFHHVNNDYRYTITGLNGTGTTYDFSVVYGAAGGGADSPALFYDGGVRKTSGISNQKLQTGAITWITSFPTATIGGASATAYNNDGRLYSIRLYGCPLSAREIAYNAAVDKVRYEGVAPAEAFNAPDMRWNATSGKVEVLVKVGMINGGGTLSINGGGVSEWLSVGDAVEIVYEPVEGEKALEWFDLPDGALRSSDLFTVNFTVEAPVSATLQMLTKADVTRALNADPGIEEGIGSFNDGANRSFSAVSWNRNADRAWFGSYSTPSDARGWNYLYPYQQNSFFQSGLAIPAGDYTLTLEHAAAVTAHTIFTMQLVDTNNVVVQSICAVTNEMRIYGTSWHTVQQDFTVAEDGIYTFKLAFTASGTHGNCYSCFDNVSITSDTDLHIEVDKCYPYFGEGQARPPVVVRDDDGNILTEGVDYDLFYGANNSVGTNLDSAVSLRHGNGYVAARGKGTHYGVAGSNFRLGKPIFVKPDGSPTNAMMRSGLGYLTRKGVSDADAAAILERNWRLVSTDTDKGGFHRPEDTNKFRTNVPIFVLLRKDGAVAARLTYFGKWSSPMAGFNWDNAIKRFDEMLEIAKDTGDHADPTEIENDDATTTPLSFRANGGSAYGEISHTDFQDVFKLEGVGGNALQKVTVDGASDAVVSVQFMKLNAEGKSEAVGTAATGKLSEGVVLEQTFTEAGDYFVKV